MIPFHRIEQSIPDLTALVVIITTMSAFALSFCNLQAAAIEAGINPWLSWLWPVCIDAVLIGGSLMILRSSLKNESSIVGWSVLLSFTCISTTFNVFYSPDDIFSRAAHALPPVALCVSVELLMIIIRSDLKTSTQHQESIFAHGIDQVRSISVEVDQPSEQKDQIHDQDQTSCEQILSASEPDVPVKVSITITDANLIEIMSQPGITISEASRQTGIPRGTLSRRVNALKKSGHLNLNAIPAYQESDTTYRTTELVEAVQ